MKAISLGAFYFRHVVNHNFLQGSKERFTIFCFFWEGSCLCYYNYTYRNMVAVKMVFVRFLGNRAKKIGGTVPLALHGYVPVLFTEILTRNGDSIWGHT